MQCIALFLDWLSGCGGLAFACCRIWLCLAAICRWQGAKAHSLFQNLLSYLSYASYTSYPLAPHKREAPLFMLFRLLSDIGSAIICVVSRKAILGTLIFDIGGSRKIAAAGPKGQNLLPPWHNARRRRSRGILTRTSVAYAVLRIWLYRKTTKISR